VVDVRQTTILSHSFLSSLERKKTTQDLSDENSNLCLPSTSSNPSSFPQPCRLQLSRKPHRSRPSRGSTSEA
jgi:hypothetical protein